MSSDEHNDRSGGKIHWGFSKTFTVLILYLMSATCILLGLKPLFDMEFELKSFANLFFVVLHGFYAFSFTTVHRNSQFIFWATSYLLLNGTTILFYYYEDIFF